MKMFKWMNAALAAVFALGMATVPAFAAETTDQPCTLSADGKVVTECEVTEGGYTYKDTYYGTETVVDLFTYAIPEGCESVDLTFDEPQLIYNYNANGEDYLAGWVEDPTVGTTAITCDVDVNKDGEYDVLQIQMPYTVDAEGNWGGGELLYAVTFKEVKNTTDLSYTVYAGSEKLSNPKVTKGGYTWYNWDGSSTTVDLYTYDLSKDTKEVDLEFAYRRLAYNYDTDGETYLDGEYEDFINGAKTKHCKVDFDQNGIPDIIQVQNTYNEDYSGAELLYAITFKYVDPLKAPANVKVLTNSKGLKVTWDKVSGAKKYAVYRKSGTGSYKLMTTTTSTSYLNEGLTNGNKYTYYVKALNKSGQKGKISTKVVKYYLKRPVISDLTSKTAGKLTVKYGKNSKATGYSIRYSRTSDFEKYTTVTVKDPATVSKTIASLTKGKKYYVKVRAYKKVDDKTYYSAWSAYKSVTIKK